MGVENLSGKMLGQYELRDVLGAGGMGIVYRAYQANLRREVAIKVLTVSLAGQQGYLARFNREAQTSAALEHTHIVPIYDYGTTNDISYIVMRMLVGGTLAQRLAQREHGVPLPSGREVSSLLKALASALDYAHRQGVIHRDIKTSNVMLDGSGSPFLVDFGIARLSEVTSSLTGTSMTIGTPSYMSPEQWRGDVVTPASDQYALGVLIYATLTGRTPFEATTPYALMHKHINDTPTPVHEQRPEIPASVDAVINRAMAKTAEDRFPNAGAFAAAFDRAVHEAGAAAEQHTEFFTAPIRAVNLPMGGLTPSRPTASGQPLAGTASGIVGAASGTPSRPIAAPASGDSIYANAPAVTQPVPQKRNILPIVLGLGAFAVIALIAVLVLNRSGGENDAFAQLTQVFFDRETERAEVNTPQAAVPTDLAGQSTATPGATNAEPTASGGTGALVAGEGTETATPTDAATDQATDAPATAGDTANPTETGGVSANDNATANTTATAQAAERTQGAIIVLLTASAEPAEETDIANLLSVEDSTATAQPTDVPTATETIAPTDTDTPLPPTATSTRTATDLPTDSPTDVPTDEPTATATLTATATYTATDVPTEIPSNTPTSTPIPPTATFTASATATLIPPTATSTATPTATFTPTPVPPTATFTASATATPVPPTATNTPTETPLPPTATFTSTVTATATETPLPPTATMDANATVTPVEVVIDRISRVGDLEQEQVEIINRGGAVDLSGWTLQTEGEDGPDGEPENMYTFPEGRTLTPGGGIILSTRDGDDSVLFLFWNRDEAAFKPGDIVRLFDAAGNEVYVYEDLLELPTFTPSPSPSPTVVAIIVTNNGNQAVNVRSGDATSFSAISTLARGDSVTLIGVSSRSSDWLLVELEDGRQGWVSRTAIGYQGSIADLERVTPPSGGGSAPTATRASGNTQPTSAPGGATAAPQATTGAQATSVPSVGFDCSGFTHQSPRDGIANGSTTFYWTTVPGLTDYWISIFDDAGNLKALSNVGSQSSATLNTSRTAFNDTTSLYLGWEVTAFDAAGQPVCNTGRLRILWAL